jgi:hypothetical protein
MNKFFLYIVLVLLLLPCFALGSDFITRDMIRHGTDFSIMRCGNARVRLQDFMHEVRDRCGEPHLVTGIQGQPNPIWAYRFGQSDHVFLVIFGNQRVLRIHRARCPTSGSGCPLGI